MACILRDIKSPLTTGGLPWARVYQWFTLESITRRFLALL